MNNQPENSRASGVSNNANAPYGAYQPQPGNQAYCSSRRTRRRTLRRCNRRRKAAVGSLRLLRWCCCSPFCSRLLPRARV